MKKLRGLSVLMAGTILVITGFQLYWLKNNYNREKRSLELKSNVTFRESVFKLQAAKLKLDLPLPAEMEHYNIDISNEDTGHLKVRVVPPEKVVSMVNVIGDRLNDTVGSEHKKINSTMVITSEKPNVMVKHEVRDDFKFISEGREGNRVIQFLYGVDSLQQPILVQEVDSACRIAFKKQNIDVPFAVTKTDSAIAINNRDRFDPGINKVTIGLSKPVTYNLALGNTFPYLLRKITLPILFSIFLVGVTILTFIVLYRNLLKQRRLSEIKNDFISNVTHELKTPIATVGVALEALRNFNAISDPQRTKEYLDISQNELGRLSLLVDKVLKLSMFEKKDLELKKEDFDLKQLAEEVIASMRLQFEKKNATVKLKTEGTEFLINADRLHITSVLYNLLDNALKYSSENPEVDLELASLPNDILEIKVRDNGVGIPKEYRSKIFEKFFRVPMGDTHNIKGYGLGLSYVSEVIRQHLGYIEVDSEPGKGSVFAIKLPKKEKDVIVFDDGRKIIKKEFVFGSANKKEI